MTRFDPVDSAVAALPEPSFDAVVCRAPLDYLPDADIPWLMERCFAARAAASICRCARIAARTRSGRHDACRSPRPQSWWLTHVERASARYPDVHWKLVLQADVTARSRRSLVREGGRRADGKAPTVWVLKDHKAGHTTQSVGLADALGFPYEIKALRFNSAQPFQQPRARRQHARLSTGALRTRSRRRGPIW